MTLREKVAREIAAGLGDDFGHAFEHKSDWNAARGESGGRYRDINEPFKPDYLNAADRILEIPEIARLTAENEGLREAAKPFAQAYDDCLEDDDLPDRAHVWEHAVGMQVTVGDFRRARAQLKGNSDD